MLMPLFRNHRRNFLVNATAVVIVTAFSATDQTRYLRVDYVPPSRHEQTPDITVAVWRAFYVRCRSSDRARRLAHSSESPTRSVHRPRTLRREIHGRAMIGDDPSHSTRTARYQRSCRLS